MSYLQKKNDWERSAAYSGLLLLVYLLQPLLIRSSIASTFRLEGFFFQALLEEQLVEVLINKAIFSFIIVFLLYLVEALLFFYLTYRFYKQWGHYKEVACNWLRYTYLALFLVASVCLMVGVLSSIGVGFQLYESYQNIGSVNVSQFLEKVGTAVEDLSLNRIGDVFLLVEKVKGVLHQDRPLLSFLSQLFHQGAFLLQLYGVYQLLYGLLLSVLAALHVYTWKIWK